MGNTSVAIITRTKDRPQLLRRTLQTILAQTHTDWEWVVVNSGDQVEVMSVVEEFGPELVGRVKLIHLNRQPLMGAASNEGVRASAARFVVLLDDDDTWESDFLEKAISVLEAKPAEGMGGVVTQTMRIDEREQGGEWVEVERAPFNGRLREVNLFDLASVNRFTVNAFVYERSAYDEIGGYREDLPVLDDWDFNLRFLRRYDVAVIPEPLANYHIRPGVASGAAANSLVAAGRLHEYFHAALVNDQIRKDLESGQAGLGLLMGAASGHGREEEKLDRLTRKLRQVSEKVGKVDARTKQMKDRGYC